MTKLHPLEINPANERMQMGQGQDSFETTL
jgi:hypothetical protein